MSEKEEQKGLLYWTVESALAFLILLFFRWWWPSLFPFDLFEFWIWDIEKIKEGIIFAFPIFLWGFVVTLILTIVVERNHKEEQFTFKYGLIESLKAGVLEELIFRWILFYQAFIGLYVSAFLFFGWLSESFEIARLLHWYVAAPVVNFLSFNTLDWMLFDKGWVVGAAVLIANAKFRNGHVYLGWFGYFNSWVIGFWLFSIMFHYGLPAAICVHFLYDLIIFMLVAIRVKITKLNEN